MMKKYLLFFTLLASLSGYSAEHMPFTSHESRMSSDHNLLTLTHPLLGHVNNLNVAVKSSLNFTTGDKKDHTPYVVFGTLRDHGLLSAIHSTRNDVYDNILKPIATIATDPNKEISVKNKELAEIYNTTLKDNFNKYLLSKTNGLEIKEINIWPKGLFNGGVKKDLLEKNPENYIHSFSISLEDSKSYVARQTKNYSHMFANKPAIVFAQEIELGFNETKSLKDSQVSSQQEDFNTIFETLMAPYKDTYKAISPKVSGRLESVAVIFHDKKLIDVSEKFNDSIQKIRGKIKTIFGYDTKTYFSENKCLVAALEFEGNVYFAINVHAEYGYVNENAEQIVTDLQNFFDERKDLNIIFGSDLNLEKQKEKLFLKTFGTRSELIKIDFTPEPAPEHGGNPTMDLIIATPIKK